MKLRFLALAGALALACAAPAAGQNFRVVGSCGAQSLRAGDGSAAFLDAAGNLCTSGGSGGTSTSTADTRASNTLNAASTSSSVVIPVNGQQTLGLTFTGLTASGATVSFSQSNDGGTTYTTVNEVNTGTGVATSARSTDGQSRVNTAGRTNIKIQVTTAGTGTVTVASNLSYGQAYAALDAPLPPGANAIGSVLSDLRVAGAAVAAGNPVPVSGAVSAAQSGTWNIVNVSGTVSLPTGAATAANQATANTSLSSLDGKTSALGTQTKAASRSVTLASDLANLEPAGTAVTGVAMPAGGTGLTGWLSAHLLRNVTYVESAAASVAASGTSTVNARTVPVWATRVNVSGLSDQTGTLTLQASYDGGATYRTVQTVALTANAEQVITRSVGSAAYRGFVTNGTTAATNVNVSLSYTAN